MVKILYFINPVPFVKPILDKGSEFIPIVGPLYKFTTKSSKIFKLADPVAAASRGVGEVAIICSGPVVKYPVLCALWFSCAVAGDVTANPVFIGAGLEFGTIIIEEVYGG